MVLKKNKIMKSLRIMFLSLGLCIAALICFAQDSNGNLVDDVPSIGALNAIKKAYQMTDLIFMPLDMWNGRALNGR